MSTFITNVLITTENRHRCFNVVL